MACVALSLLLMVMGLAVQAADVTRYDVGSSDYTFAAPIDFSKPVEFVGELTSASKPQTITFSPTPDNMRKPVAAAIYTFMGTGAVFRAELTVPDTTQPYKLSSSAVNVPLTGISAHSCQLIIHAVKFERGARYVVRFGKFDPFEVKFHGNGGTASVERVGYTPGATYGHFPSAAREEYDFVGWATAVTNGILLATNDTVCIGYTNLFAQWTKSMPPPVPAGVTNYVVFLPNGGTGNMATQTFVTGTAQALSSNLFSRTGYVFDGWSLSATDEVAYVDCQVITNLASDLSLYAHWVANTYTITLALDDGDERENMVADYGTWVPVKAPSRAGYEFSGWEAVGHNTMTAVYSPSKGVTVEMTNDTHFVTPTSSDGSVSFKNLNVGVDDDTNTTLTARWTSGVAVLTQTANGVRWHYTTSGGEAKIQNFEGTNFVAAVDVLVSGAIQIPETLGGLPVTAIGDYAFYGCFRLTGIEIPVTVTSIGNYAFAACTNLSPGITIPESVSSMGSYVFQGCKKLRVVRYLGDRPVVDAALYAGAPNDLVSGVLPVRDGWETEEITVGGNDEGAVDDTQDDASTDDTSTNGASSTNSTSSLPPVTLVIYEPWPSGKYPRVVRRWVGVTLYSLQFRVNGGEPLDEDDRIQYYVPGRTAGELPEPTHSNEDLSLEFVGWYTAAVGGTPFSEGDVVDKSYVLYAHWRDAAGRGASEWVPELYDDDEAFAATAAATFDGYVYASEGTNDADGVVSGIVTLKVARGKYNRESEETNAAVTATVQLLGDGKKIKLKGTMGEDGSVSLADAAEEHGMELQLGVNGFTGTFDDAEVSGARNRFASRASADVDACRCALQDWKRTWNVVLRTEEATGDGAAFAQGYGILTVSVGTRGKTKVSGMLADGTKVSATSQLIVGDSCCCVPVFLPLYGGKRGGLAFLLWLSEEFESVWGLSAWDATPRAGGAFAATLEMAGLGEAGADAMADGEAEFSLDGEFELEDAEILSEYLPQGVALTIAGRTWKTPKAGRVKYDRKEEDFVATADENPSGLKLTCALRAGTFKGSFKVYAAVSETRLKTYTATVTGAVVDGVGYGTATVKKVGSLPVKIE